MLRHFPTIGLRIFKSAIAVALCFVISYFRKNEGIVFYSLLSALWCIQMYKTNTKRNAVQRFSGTVIGALNGLLYLLILRELIKSGADKTEEGLFFIQAALVSVFTIIVLYTTVLLKKKQASYFSCVVFLSIAVNHVTDLNPYLFVWNRFLDTCIGIAVGLFVNGFSLPLKKKKDIHLKLPVIAMDGAVLYDMEEKMYRKVYVISAATSQKLLEIIRQAEVNCFTNVIMDDMLVIYYSESSDDCYNDMVKTLRRSPFRNYVKRKPPKDNEVVYFLLLDKKDKMEYLKRMTGLERTVTFGSIPGCYDVTITEGDSNKVVHVMKRYFEYGIKPY